MASISGSVWAIDIGNNSLKALHLRAAGETLEVIGFDNLEHDKILTADGVTSQEKAELIAATLRNFVQRNDLGKDEVIISVPGHNCFARFVKLPPVEQKRISEIVKFEAIQQIPFGINEVEWDWQLMTGPDTSDVQVGIFAIKNEVIDQILGYYGRENIKVVSVQMAPMALYNCISYDRSDLSASDKTAIIVLDMGAENTDLVVCTRSVVWQRCIPLGGNAFTKSISDAFKVKFDKAEKLKRTAPMSQYARQIFQAMRPVFTDLTAEIQRSLGYYRTSNRDIRFDKVIVFGGGMKMQGLAKFLQQTLQLPVQRPDSFEKLLVAPNVSAAKFHENISDFGVVYGLALQGLGLAKVESNLLPRRIARSMTWARKANYFIAAAVALLIISILCLGRAFFDVARYEGNAGPRKRIASVISTARTADKRLKAEQTKDAKYEGMIEKQMAVFKYRDVIPLLQQTIISSLPNAENNPAQARLYNAFDRGDVEIMLTFPRKRRQQIFVTSASVEYVDDIAAVSFHDATARRTRDLSTGDEDEDEYDSGRRAGWRGRFTRRGRGYRQISRRAQKDEQKAGFVVVIEGYSPYENIGNLLDPAGVGDDESKWGFVTRLANLDPNGPFQLYSKADVEHFSVKTGEVTIEDERMRVGIGVERVLSRGPQQAATDSSRFERGSSRATGTDRVTSERVLLDPMTNEEVSTTFLLDAEGNKRYDTFGGKPKYIVNDYWFRIKAKFVWKDAPTEQPT